MYFGHLKAYRTDLVREVGGFRPGFEGATDYDLALRLAERTDRIRHIPKVLYHWRAARDSVARTTRTKPYSLESGRRAVAEACHRGMEGSKFSIVRDTAFKPTLGPSKPNFAMTDLLLFAFRGRADLLNPLGE